MVSVHNGFSVLLPAEHQTCGTTQDAATVVYNPMSDLFPKKLPLILPFDDYKFTEVLFAGGSCSFHTEVFIVDKIL